MATSTGTVSVHRHCVRKLGVHRGAIAAARVAQWAMATAELGHIPSTTEYAEWWAVDERTGWRHRAAVRSVFGENWQPTVERIAAEAARGRLRSPRAVQQLSISPA
jgi:hypothetical protein